MLIRKIGEKKAATEKASTMEMKERKRRKSYLISAFVATKAEWKIRIYSADSYDREESEANAILIDGKADAASLYLGA